MRVKRRVLRFKLLSYLWLLTLAFSALAAATSQAPQDVPFYKKVLNFMDNHPLLTGSIFLILTTIVTTAFSLIRRDKCLRKLKGKFVTLYLRNWQLYSGIFRLETTGIEIVSEKARAEGKEASFLLSGGKWKDQVHAFVRYLDLMLEKERQERDNELEKVYHPRPAVRLKRKIKVFLNTIKNALSQILSKAIGAIKGKIRAGEAVEFIQKTSEEALEYTVETVYDRLIDRLVGTKVVVKAGDKEYVGVLADYTNEWLELMEVNYRDYWEVTVEIAKCNYKDPRGLKIERHGDTLLIENHGPFRVQLQRLWFQHDRKSLPEQRHDLFKNIEPFGKLEIKLKPHNIDVVVSPFSDVKVSVPVAFNQYTHLKLSFETWRMADLTLPRGYAVIIHRAEKYEPKLLSISTLTEMILGEELKDFILTDKNGKPIKYLTFNQGYVTNLDKERMDLKEISQAYALRWEVERIFQEGDARLRPLGGLFNGKANSRSGAMVAQMVLLKLLTADPTIRRPHPNLLYFPLAWAGKGKYKPREIGLPVKVLVLTGNSYNLEFPVLQQQVKYVGNRKIVFERTSDKKLPRLNKADILWIGYAEASNDRYQFNYEIEKKLKSFVADGGVLIAMGQRSRPKRSARMTWLPEPVEGRRSEQLNEFDPTLKAGKLFRKPNRIKPGHLALTDPWIKWSDNYEVLATVKFDGREAAAILKLEYGRGMVILTALKNETVDNVRLNAPMMENLIHYAVEWINERERKRKKERMRWAA